MTIMKNKIIYLGMEINGKPATGGEYLQKHNRELLKRIFKEVYIIEIPKVSAFVHLRNLLFRKGYGYTNLLKSKIEEALQSNYELAFLDSSAYGSYVRLFKERGLKTIVFCHNVEHNFYKEKYLSRRTLVNWGLFHYIHFQEKLSIKHASRIIVLNSRDFNGIKFLYQRNADLIMPVYHDSINTVDLVVKNIEDRYLMFVGANFFANNEGIIWFIKEVSPFIKIKIYIAGGCCDSVKSALDISKYKNIRLLGFVEDLDYLYKHSLGVINPIFKGSGMKTKTIEALKYGKNIFGTTEAFEGINADFDMIGGLCNTADEFVTAINKANLLQFNAYSHAVFLSNYSTETVLPKFDFFVSELIGSNN